MTKVRKAVIAADDVAAGETKAIGFLVGQVMKASREKPTRVLLKIY